MVTRAKIFLVLLFYTMAEEAKCRGGGFVEEGLGKKV
jgi:hypothetical protein